MCKLTLSGKGIDLSGVQSKNGLLAEAAARSKVPPPNARGGERGESGAGDRVSPAAHTLVGCILSPSSSTAHAPLRKIDKISSDANTTNKIIYFTEICNL